MELKNKFARPALLAALIAASGTASAVTWDFQASPPANHMWGSFQAFDSNPASGVMIGAFGYDSTGARTNLFSKFSGTGSDETGLGLFRNKSDNEITAGASIVLDMTSAAAAFGNTFTITLGSLQSGPGGHVGENADIYECKDSGCTLRLQLGNISGPPVQNSKTFTLNTAGGYDFFQILGKSLAGTGADELLDAVTASSSSVPEPATLGLLGLGLAGLGFMRRRKAS
jgi:PEP-CTERM motif